MTNNKFTAAQDNDYRIVYKKVNEFDHYLVYAYDKTFNRFHTLNFSVSEVINSLEDLNDERSSNGLNKLEWSILIDEAMLLLTSFYINS